MSRPMQLPSGSADAHRWLRQFGKPPILADVEHMQLRKCIKEALLGPHSLVLPLLSRNVDRLVEVVALLEPAAAATRRAGWLAWARAALLEGAGPAQFLAKAPLAWQPRPAVMDNGKVTGDPVALLAEDDSKWHAEWQAGAATYQDLPASARP